LPKAPRYNLSALTEQLKLTTLENAHDALADSIAAMNLYQALWQKLIELPLQTLEEIVHLSSGVPTWGGTFAFSEAYRLRRDSGAPDAVPPKFDVFEPSVGEWTYLRPRSDRKELDVEQLAGLIDRGGLLSQRIESYESRESQIEMLRTVADGLNNGQHLLIEAPTGTGKSIAYALPAIYWAVQNGERVIISTATIALQDQLIKKDLPLLQKTLNLKFEASVLKGRSNYLCPRRLDALRRRPPTSVDELRVVAKIIVWLLETESADRNEISLRGQGEELAWRRLSAEDEGCTLGRCEEQMLGACPFYKARKRAEASHLIVVNHSLLLSDVQVDGKVLPEYRYLVVDEAHHLEDAATNGLTVRIDRNALRRRFDDLGDTSRGLLGSVLGALRGRIEDKYYKNMENYIRIVVNAIENMSFHLENYFKSILNCLVETGELRQGEGNSQIRITTTIRQNASWAQVELAWEPLSEFTKVIAEAMEEIAKGLANFADRDIDDYEDLLVNVTTASRYLRETHQYMDQFTDHPDENAIYWCEVGQYAEWLTILAAPLHVGPMIEQHLWSQKEGIILASATLRTAGSFDYLRERISAHESEVGELIVETPFDYKTSALIFVPTDIPEPNVKHQYQTMVERGLIDLAVATEGRVLGLFTSYMQLKETAQTITPMLAEYGITVFDQASGSSREALIEGFKSADRAVLLGTRSFWEGVDLPGDDLLAVAIVRLPFAVPSDPIFAARSEQYENSFMEYAVPEAILRFRQGFGRLIRRKTDRGVVVIFDRRVISKKYGKMFLESLPECTVQYAPLGKLADSAKTWLDR
jgi:ATP-dependent DNA helicase DinG